MTFEQPVFCVSDHTGLTAEGLAHSVMAMFDSVLPDYRIHPFVVGVDQAAEIANEIDALARIGPPPIIFATLVDPAARKVLSDSKGIVVYSHDKLVETVGSALGSEPSVRVGGYHGIHDLQSYQVRIDALDFALATDDGVGLSRYPSADVIILGVSRVGKTPTCLYLSMHYGIRAANYPLAPEDLRTVDLPEALSLHRRRLFGLTVTPERLHEIRQRRRPGSDYASVETCLSEVSATKRMYETYDITYIDSTNLSVEEIAVTVIRQTGVERRLG